MVQPVSDVGSNAEENIAHAAQVIGRSQQRRKVFTAIYTGKTKQKSVTHLIRITGLPHTRVLDAGKRLSDNNIVRAVRVDGEISYEKLGFFQSNKRKILALAASPAKLQSYPTKRNPAVSGRVLTVRLSAQRARVEAVTVDEIDSFRRVRRIEHGGDELGDALSETAFKHGLQRVLGEGGRFKDWGGEVADVFTTRLTLGGKRRFTAVALKGPATKGKLTPGKLGKNGDQIQRLFEAPANVFLVQYCREIDQSVSAQMKQLAITKSLMIAGRVWFGTIDGRDSARLVEAYPQQFNQRPVAAKGRTPSTRRRRKLR